MAISRRAVVTGFGAAVLIAPVSAIAEHLRPTPQETLGPFFPVATPAPHDFDLTHVAGRSGRATGQIIELTGRVLRVDRTPVPSATVEVWQANAAGRYNHPLDKNPAPLDPNFRGVALLRSTAEGRYRIRTVKPGAYADPAGGTRTPHIHFDIFADDYRLVTQMYFPGEKLNETDTLFSTMAARHHDPALAICKAVDTHEPNVLAFEWDIVLLQG